MGTIKRARSLDGSSFGVYRFALHLCGDPHLAEDLAQEAMLRAVRQGEKLRDPGRLRIWLLRVVENLWRDWCRLKQRRPSDRLPDEEVGVQQMLPCEEASLAEEVVRTMNAMGELPERQRSVLHLIACEELSVDEVAEILQISPEAVRSSLSVARSQMRKKCTHLEKNSLHHLPNEGPKHG